MTLCIESEASLSTTIDTVVKRREAGPEIQEIECHSSPTSDHPVGRGVARARRRGRLPPERRGLGHADGV